jgi:hypothetical protein
MLDPSFLWIGRPEGRHAYREAQELPRDTQVALIRELMQDILEDFPDQSPERKSWEGAIAKVERLPIPK